MTYTFRVRYSEDMLRAAVRALVFHWLGGWTFVLTVFAAAVLCGILISFGGDHWFVAFVTGLLTCSLLFVAYVWRSHLRNTLGKFRRMAASEATFTLTDHSITVSTDSGLSATLPWSSFQEIWGCKDCWLLSSEPNDFITLPTHGVPEEALNFVRSKIGKYKSIVGSSK